MLFESELEKLLRSFRILDPNTRLTARDVAVAQAIHPFVTGAAKPPAQRLVLQSLSPGRNGASGCRQKWWFAVSRKLGGVDSFHEFVRSVAPTPISPTENCGHRYGELEREL